MRTTNLFSTIPKYELHRSPAAKKIGDLAQESELFLSHYEYRKALEPAEFWLPENRPDLGKIETWQSGVLPESKYQSFRTDIRIGSYHPGHQAKWTTHELCHGLVGFAWKPDASFLFHALAARLAELLPVALFYFYDDAYLNRCDKHKQIPQYGKYCKACEDAAKGGSRSNDENAEKLYRQGNEFIERELHAIRQSIKTGYPIESPWGHLNLSSDGLAYASAQGLRLQSEAYKGYIDMFFPEGGGLHHSLEQLEARVTELQLAITEGKSVTRLKGNAELWKVQDIAWRVIEISAQTEGELQNELHHLLENLASNKTQDGINQLVSNYSDLAEEYFIPEPEHLFAVGYPLTQHIGFSTSQIIDGLKTVCPITLSKLDHYKLTIDSFIQVDKFDRRFLGFRFSDWLKNTPLHTLALTESRLIHVPQQDNLAYSLGESKTTIVNPNIHFIETTSETLSTLKLSDETPEKTPLFLVIKRERNGETSIIDIEKKQFCFLLEMQQQGQQLSVEHFEPENVFYELFENEILVPYKWKI